MTLKHKKSHPPPAASGGSSDKWTGPWGRINPESASFDVVRFCQGAGGHQRTHSYPYRVISSWHWTAGETEELRIKASADLVTVRGRGLDRIVEALDRSTLEILREIPPEASSSDDEAIFVLAIQVDDRRAEMPD
jgi:hypothetical protein